MILLLCASCRQCSSPRQPQFESISCIRRGFVNLLPVKAFQAWDVRPEFVEEAGFSSDSPCSRFPSVFLKMDSPKTSSQNVATCEDHRCTPGYVRASQERKTSAKRVEVHSRSNRLHTVATARDSESSSAFKRVVLSLLPHESLFCFLVQIVPGDTAGAFGFEFGTNLAYIVQ